ncbi:hypothetical protein OKW32_000388 [Paraburkholderia youngii]
MCSTRRLCSTSSKPIRLLWAVPSCHRVQAPGACAAHLPVRSVIRPPGPAAHDNSGASASTAACRHRASPSLRDGYADPLRYWPDAATIRLPIPCAPIQRCNRTLHCLSRNSCASTGRWVRAKLNAQTTGGAIELLHRRCSVANHAGDDSAGGYSSIVQQVHAAHQRSSQIGTDCQNGIAEHWACYLSHDSAGA